MKFLCDNCKAKYQIADEKVAGKTVRMKCRKCGHQIEVRAAVTETSVSTSPPQAAVGGSGSEAPRAGGAPGKSSLATSLSAQKPRAPAAAPATAPGGALAGAFQRTVQDGPQTAPSTQPGGSIELSVTDEWYVAINGVPVGPVRISELRRKAASGAVNEDSLCWQEGLEEWRPVRSIPELAAIVREAAQGNRPSLISPPPTEGRASSPPRAPQRPPSPSTSRVSEPPRPEPVREPPRPPMAPTAPAAPSRSNVVPLRVAASNASIEDVAPNTAPLGGGAAAARAPSFTPMPAPAFATQSQPQMQIQPAPPPAPAPPPPAPLAISDPFAVPPAPLAVGSGSHASVAAPAPYSPSIVPPAPKRSVPLWFWPVLLFTGTFGVGAAFFVFKQQQQPVVIQVPTPAAPTSAAQEPKPDVPPPTPSAETSAAASAPTTSGTKVATGGPKAANPTPPKPGGGIDLSGIGPVGAGGPNVGPNGGGGGGGGGVLDQASVERVVASRKAGVKRTCMDRGSADQKASVNVTVTATVGPDGRVIGTSSTGDDPIVAKCIEGQVRTWSFNAPGATTSVAIPFKFVRQ